jgi:hypothetical protein
MASEWYLADLVVEYLVTGDRNVVHVNTVLIEGDSPEVAYTKAVELGTAAAVTYTNSAGQPVVVRFRGLKDLFPVSEDPADGAELFYAERINVAEDEIVSQVRTREHLTAFRQPPRYNPDRPDISDQTIVAELVEQLGLSDDTGDDT